MNDDTFSDWARNRRGSLSDMEMTKFCVDFMLQDIKGLRVIQKVSDLLPDEYAVAFRLSSDGDFHYIKRADNGHWFHKMGRSVYILSMKQEEVFSPMWCDRYDLPMVLFAKKKSS